MQPDAIRIPPLDPQEFTAEQRELVGGWSVLNFSRVLARHPALYRTFVPLVEVIRYSDLPPRDREILVIRALALCNETYEAQHHVDIAHKVGMSDDDITAIRHADKSLPEFECWLIKAADELMQQFRLSDDTWAALAQRYDTTQMMEVVGLVGCYATMAMITRSFGIEPESKQESEQQLQSLRDYT